MIPFNGKVTGVQPTVSALSQIPSLLVQAAIGGMTEVLTLFSQTARERFLRGPYPTEVARRSGHFASTFTRGNPENIFEVTSQGSVITGRFGSTAPQARVLDEGTGYLPGGVIKPTRGSFLAIPAEAALTPTGRLKSQYAAARTSWRGVPNTFVGRGRRGGLFIAERSMAGRSRGFGRGRFRVLAWLVRQVRIAGRFYMRKTLQVVQPQIVPIFQKRVDQVLQRATATINRFRGAA